MPSPKKRVFENYVLIYHVEDEPLHLLSMKPCFRHWPMTEARKLEKRGARCIGFICYGKKVMVPFALEGRLKKVLSLFPPRLPLALLAAPN